MYIDISWIFSSAEIIALLIIGYGVLRLVILRRKDQEREKRVYASSFVKAWNSPELLEGNRIVLLAGRNWQNIEEEQFQELIKDDTETYFRVITLLNFFEEMAQAVELNLADDESLQIYFLPTATSTFKTFQNFIMHLRSRSQSDQLFSSFEKMVYQWMHNTSHYKNY